MKLNNIILKTWRNKWKSLLGLVLSVALCIAATYAIYNYSAKRAFHAFESSWTAHGETLNIADLQAPQPSDEDNFFQSPSFLAEKNNTYPTKLSRPRDGTIRGFNKYSSAYSIYGKGDYHMGVGTDITYWLDSSGHPSRKSIRSRRGGKRNPAKTKPAVASPAFNEKETALACLKLLAPYEDRLTAISIDSQRPRSWIPPHLDINEAATNTIFDHYTPLDDMRRTLQTRSILYILAEDPKNSAHDLHTIIRIQKHADPFPSVLGHLLHLATLYTIEPPLWEGLNRHSWNDTTLAAFEAQLASLDFRKTLLQKMREEVCFTHSMTQKIISDPDYLQQQREEFESTKNKILGPLGAVGSESWSDKAVNLAAKAVPDGYFISQGSWTLQTYQDTLFYPHGKKATSITMEQVKLTRNSRPSDPLLKLTDNMSMAPIMLRQLEKTLHAQASLHNMRTAIALERYHLKHQNYPEKLSDLVPDYLPKELEDVITGKPLHYQIKPDGTPLIYSIGVNEKDDDGKPNRKPNNGDWSWMYSPPAGFTYSDYRKLNCE